MTERAACYILDELIIQVKLHFKSSVILTNSQGGSTIVYTVGKMAKMLEVPASTLRYYDKEGLLPFVERSPGGMRMFQEKDFEWL